MRKFMVLYRLMFDSKSNVTFDTSNMTNGGHIHPYSLLLNNEKELDQVFLFGHKIKLMYQNT